MTTGEWGIVKSWSRAGCAATVAALQILDNPRICKSEAAHGLAPKQVPCRSCCTSLFRCASLSELKID